MLKTIDLFAGAGGLSLGFQLTGKFKLVAAAEINKNAQKTYKKNLTNNNDEFVFIDNIVGYDFAGLNKKLGGIDIVIGGPPCQGFSNANRQKNQLISMNNGLIKEFFRAIKEIQPKAFIMENVSMLRSDKHRFYESKKDNQKIAELIKEGFEIQKRQDTLYLADNNFDGIDLKDVDNIDFDKLTLPVKLYKLISVLNKNLKNPQRLTKYLQKHSLRIIKLIEKYIATQTYENNDALHSLIINIQGIKDGLLGNSIQEKQQEIEYIVSLQKLISLINEIKENELIGKFELSENGTLQYKVASYSVIDYVKAILGGAYQQIGDTVNAEWFGVPQIRKRYIVMGIRKDLCISSKLELPKKPLEYTIPNVGDAIGDLKGYQVGYDPKYAPIFYGNDDVLSDFAKEMRKNSDSVKNHIITKTTAVAMKRFEVIKQGKNFHSLSVDMKSTYAKPDRTQNTIYLRLNSLEPSETVVNVRKSMWIHPDFDRAISVREAARLQSFPDTFEFVGSKDSQYQQVGNAVPPLLAKGIANKLLEYVKE